MKTVLLEKENNFIKVTEDTLFVLNTVDFNKQSLELIFEKQGASAKVLGLYVLENNDSVDISTISNHKVPHTSCEVDIKGVLKDFSESDYVGKILINKKAQQTSSFLHDNVLVIGENTKNASQPILEIEANDVKASHGATTGRINKEEVYYLQSRGFSKQEAENLIVSGFLYTVLNQIEDNAIVEKFIKKLNLKNE